MATVFTNVGRQVTTNRVKGSGPEPNYIGWGSGSGTAVVTDTTLFSEILSRTLGTSTQVTTTTTSDTYQVVGTVSAAGSVTITNAGLFDAATGGNLFMKGNFTGVALTIGEGIQFTMKVQYS